MPNHGFSTRSASDLMQVLLDRGYFHNGGTKPLQERATSDDSIEVMQKIELFLITSDDCEITQSHDSRYLTKSKLKAMMHAVVLESGGRLTNTQASMALAVNIDSPKQGLPENVTEIGDEILTERYFDEQVKAISLYLTQSETGCLAVSDVASQFLHLPMEFVLSLLQSRMHLIDARIISMHGSKMLINSTFDARERVRIRGALRALTVPTQVDALSLGDTAYVLQAARNLCESREVHGVLREKSAILGLYIPDSYQLLLRECVDELFLAQGYISVDKCQAMGVPSASVATFVKKSFPSAVCLSNFVVAPNVIIAPLISVVQETLEESSFLDLRVHIAEALVTNEANLRELLNNHVLAQIPNSNDAGKLVISMGEVLFVSRGMIQRLSTTILPHLIESFAKRRALELDQGSNAERCSNEVGMKSANKVKKKAKKDSANSKLSAMPGDNRYFGVVPLSAVVAKVAEEEVELASIHENHRPVTEASPDEELFLWEPEEASESSTGLLHEFCRIAFFTDNFRSSCARAVEAEMELLRSRKNAVSTRSGKDGSSKIRTFEGAFEDPSCFNAACFQLQVHCKFLDYLVISDISDELLSLYKLAFLEECCANFANRITQYCLLKNDLVKGVFNFDNEQGAIKEKVPDDDVALPSYCQPVNITQNYFPSYYLRCLEEQDGKFRDPLNTMRIVLSGNLGTVLARTWTLCGGKCYAGGTKAGGMEGACFVSHGNAEGFMAHVLDHCLLICGIPFKKLDKKSEKQYLFKRRQELTARLMTEVEADKVLELTVLLLFQQVRNVCAFGSVVMLLLPVLCKEKKISNAIAEELSLLELTTRVGSWQASDNALMERVRVIGLCKDVSKYRDD